MGAVLSSLGRSIQIAGLRVRGAPVFRCPLCEYRGAFRPYAPPTGLRLHAMCPGCGALERHRLQWAVAGPLLRGSMRVLHIAPETFVASLIRPRVARYVAADLMMAGVDCRVDMTELPFRRGSFDLVWASHVLEHIRDDSAAVAEIGRVLVPGGLAVLAVPIKGPVTVEFAAPKPEDSNHVRSPGMDYFDRYRKVFSEVRLTCSDDVPPDIQPFVCVGRVPSGARMLRPAQPVERLVDYVPVCVK